MKELRRFARANGLAMVDGNVARFGAEERAELQRRRAARGLRTPTMQPAPAQRPDYDAPVPVERIPAELRGFRRRHRHRHSAESARKMMHAFFDQLPDELTPVAWLYSDLATRTEGAPDLTTLSNRFNGFA